jgi:hypothetical protein
MTKSYFKPLPESLPSQGGTLERTSRQAPSPFWGKVGIGVI